MILGGGCRENAEVIMVGKDKDARGAIMIDVEESLWSTDVLHLSLSFPLFLVNRNLFRVRQDCLAVHLPDPQKFICAFCSPSS